MYGGWHQKSRIYASVSRLAVPVVWATVGYGRVVAYILDFWCHPPYVPDMPSILLIGTRVHPPSPHASRGHLEIT